MVEKWLQSKPNPYINKRPQPSHKPTSFAKNVAAHHGTPIQLFKDSDKDGVANVFDCKPYNKSKQDVISPQNFGSGIRDMYARQEAERQNREYLKVLREMQRQEEQRVADFNRANESTTTTSPGNVGAGGWNYGNEDKTSIVYASGPKVVTQKDINAKTLAPISASVKKTTTTVNLVPQISKILQPTITKTTPSYGETRAATAKYRVSKSLGGMGK